MVKERVEHDFWISDYFSANRAINYANIPYWVSASVQGALLAATRNDNTDKAQNVSIDPAHALAAGIAVAACRRPLGVAFSYAAALFTYLPLQLNISMIARMPQGY